MKEYPKIQTIFKRDPATQMKTLLMGEWSEPEFGYLANCEWVFTEKVDGTNIRVQINEGSIRFGGKTDGAQIPATLVERLQQRFLPQQDALLAQFPDGGCLYGEGYGAKIQKGGGNYRSDQDIVLFDVKVGDWWLQRESVEEVAKQFGLDVVPIIGRGTLFDLIEKVRIGFNSTWGSFPAEGIVARPAVELKSRAGHRIITKLKHRDFAVPK
jgi:ATP-dependent RNA circularization protein (DNA/RNA ligase family)